MLVTGCATTQLIPQANTSETPRDHARILVARPSGIVGAGNGTVISANGQTVGTLYPGGQLCWDTKPGLITLVADWKLGGEQKSITDYLVAGTTYRFTCDIWHSLQACQPIDKARVASAVVSSATHYTNGEVIPGVGTAMGDVYILPDGGCFGGKGNCGIRWTNGAQMWFGDTVSAQAPLRLVQARSPATKGPITRTPGDQTLRGEYYPIELVSTNGRVVSGVLVMAVSWMFAGGAETAGEWQPQADVIDPTTSTILEHCEAPSQFTDVSGLADHKNNQVTLPFSMIYKREGEPMRLYFRVGRGYLTLPWLDSTKAQPAASTTRVELSPSWLAVSTELPATAANPFGELSITAPENGAPLEFYIEFGTPTGFGSPASIKSMGTRP